ncbi:MAG: DUF4080 domain-containing protein [Desulfuromonadaceae bacterium]|nr:DUF4080 domain-containing protein [Desulfuromonadaceae bacterium]
MRTTLTTLHSKYIHASLALPYLAAYCAADCTAIEIREFTVHEPKINVLAALLATEPDVVAFSVYLWNRRETLELVAALHAVRPTVRIVLGGPEVSFDGPALFTQHPGISALVRGEGELPLRALLSAWARGAEPDDLSRLTLRRDGAVVVGPDAPPLADLDTLPSPFTAGLVDAQRGLVYYETSRGCPYRCAFCMSALDTEVRSFSRARIEGDLGWLLARRVPVIKVVDRTFNYNAARAREILAFIVQHHRASRIHLEIGAQLLDEETLTLLENAPPGIFQFEIGVQTILPETLATVGRTLSAASLETVVRRLRRANNIPVHLDLLAGLPGETEHDVLAAVDRMLALHPHHLQLEPVKLLPGSPLRDRAAALGLVYDPHPPYTVLTTPTLSFAALERLRDVSRILDLTWNDGSLIRFLNGLAVLRGSLAAAVAALADDWRGHDYFRQPVARRGVFERIWRFVREHFRGDDFARLRDLLARDLACSERIVPGKAPELFDDALGEEETRAAQKLVRKEVDAVRGQGVKVMHFAARFSHLPDQPEPVVVVFFYLTRSGAGMTVKEVVVGSE